jgi:hypothetical protein
MANYIIIGGDNKEYGPVNEADVRQWIAEGRLDAKSRVKAESDAEFRDLAQFPEFAAALGVQGAASTQTSAPAPVNFLERDYELDLGGCIAQGWEVLKNNFGTVFGAFAILVLVWFAFYGALNVVMAPFGKSLLQAPIVIRLGSGYLITALASLIIGPLMGGFYLTYLKVIRGEETSVGEVFSGFQKAYWQLFLGSLVVSLIASTCLLPFQYVWQIKAGPLLAQIPQMQSDPTALQNLLPQFKTPITSSLPVMGLCMVPLTFFTVCFQFTLQLIADKGMDFGTAMKASWNMVLKHWWQVFGLTLLVGLVMAIGLLACCVGVLVTVPIGFAAQLIAYETIFGVQKH